MRTHLIIYGVFENEHCFMVGSTQNPIEHRAYQYRRFKWFDPSKHRHRVLWEGDVISEDAEQLRFLRAVKEARMIGQMKTWYNQGGRNQTNPIAQAMGMPFGYCEVGKRYGHLGGKIGGKTRGPQAVASGQLASICKAGNAALPREARVRGGFTTAKIRKESGADVAWGKEQGQRNVENGVVFKAAHTRWHVKREIKKLGCTLCQI
jgi:hypothetical protein